MTCSTRFMAAPVSIHVSHLIAAPPEAVFDAWLDAESAAQFLFATPGGVMEKVEINPRIGGGFEIVERRGAQMAAHYGTYVEIDRPGRLVFDFRTDPEGAPTRVTIACEAQAESCVVTIAHELAPEWSAYAERTRAGWLGIMQGLARVLIGRENA